MPIPANKLTGNERFYIVVNNRKITVSLNELVAFIRSQMGA